MYIRIAIFSAVVVFLAAGMAAGMAASVSAQTPPTPLPTPMQIDQLPQNQVPQRTFDRETDAPQEIERLKAICNQPPQWSGRDRTWGALNCHIRRVVQAMTVVGVGLAGFSAVWGGIRIITEGADKDEAGKGLQSIWGTLLGLFVVGLALTMAAFITSGLSSDLATYIPWSPLAEPNLAP